MDPDSRSNHPEVGAKLFRLLRPSIVVLCGPAACGKSTFAKNHFRPTQIISSDWARGLVCDDERDQRYNSQAFALVHFLVDQRLRLNRLCVVDSTAITGQSRRELLVLARRRQVPATLVLFNVPLGTCLERDVKRERSVGRAVVERQYLAFEECKGALHQEGFDQILEFQEGDSEKVQIEVLFRPVTQSAQHPQGAGAGSQRRFERPPQPSGNRLAMPSDDDNSVSASSVDLPGPQARAANANAASVPILKSATTAGQTSMPVTAITQAPEFRQSNSPASAGNITSTPPARAVNPAPSIAHQEASVGVKSAGG